MTVTHSNRRSSLKLAALAAAALSLFALAVLSGCEQPTDPKKEEDTSQLPAGLTQSTATAATAENITGIWVTTHEGSGSSSTDGEYTYKEEMMLTIKADGTFITFSKQTNTSTTDSTNIWYWYTAYKGTYTFTEGVITWTQTHQYVDQAVFNPESLTEQQWYPETSPNVEAEPLVIIDGKLCPGAYRRTGTGTGLVGTWTQLSFESRNGESDYNKIDVVFTDTELTVKSYYSTTTSFSEPPSYTITFTYTLPGDNKISYTKDTETRTDEILFSGDWFALGSSNIYSKVTP